MADIAVNWVIVDRGYSAGRIGLGSAVLAGFIIGEELPVRSSPLDRLCFLANDSLLSWALSVVLLDVWWFWWEVRYLPLLYLDTSSTLTVVLPAGSPLLGRHLVCLDLASIIP